MKLFSSSYRFSLIFCLLLLTGCATAPTQKELAEANYGSYLSQEDAQTKAIIFLKEYLKDPESTKIEWGEFKKGWMREAPIFGCKLRFGYILKANINSKNSFGGYTGYKPYQFFFFNGSIVSIYAQQTESYMEKIY